MMYAVSLDKVVVEFTSLCCLINSETIQKMHVTLLATEH